MSYYAVGLYVPQKIPVNAEHENCICIEGHGTLVQSDGWAGTFSSQEFHS